VKNFVIDSQRVLNVGPQGDRKLKKTNENQNYRYSDLKRLNIWRFVFQQCMDYKFRCHTRLEIRWAHGSEYVLARSMTVMLPRDHSTRSDKGWTRAMNGRKADMLLFCCRESQHFENTVMGTVIPIASAGAISVLT
jgi:hypothetical protein